MKASDHLITTAQMCMFGVTILAAVLFAVFFEPKKTTAVGQCPCCMFTPGVKGSPCPDTPCPICKDLKCEGQCVPGPGMPWQCIGTGCSGNKKGDGDKADGMPKIPEMPKPPEKPPEPPKNDPNNLDTCIADPASTSSPPKRINKYTGQPCEGSSSSALNNFFDDTFNRGADSDSGGSKLKDIASDILSSLGFGSSKETPPVKAKEQVTKDKTATTSPEDSTDIEFKEEVFEGPGGVTVRGSGFDAKTNTGIAGFFGRLFSQRPLSREDTFLGRLCTARPWQASFVTRLFSPAFFDSLCARRGYAVGGGASRGGGEEKSGSPTARATLSCPANAPMGGEVKVEWNCFKTRSAGVGFDTKGAFSGSVILKGQTTTTYALQCANGRHASCTTIVATPRAQIVAHPPRVRLNSRATIYWTSEFVSECTVTGPGMKERGLRGAATTIPILDRVVFSIVCKVDGGADVKESVTVHVGP